MTQASAACAVYPPSRPTIPGDLRAHALGILQGRHQIRADVLFQVAAAHREHQHARLPRFSRLTRSHASKTVAQPSSLVRAVNSETLSVGA